MIHVKVFCRDSLVSSISISPTYFSVVYNAVAGYQTACFLRYVTDMCTKTLSLTLTCFEYLFTIKIYGDGMTVYVLIYCTLKITHAYEK